MRVLNTMTCTKCKQVITNVSPTCLNDEIHEIDPVQFKANKDMITEHFFRNIEFKQSHEESTSDRFKKMYLTDAYIQDITDPIQRMYNREKDQNTERLKLDKSMIARNEPQETRKQALKEFDERNAPIYYQLISRKTILSLNADEPEIDDLVKTVVDKIIIPSVEMVWSIYTKYIEVTTGVKFKKLNDLYPIIYRAFESSVTELLEENSRLEALMSPNRLETVLREHVIDIVCERTEAKTYLSRMVTEYIQNQRNGSETFRKVIDLFVGIKLLRSQEAELYYTPELYNLSFLNDRSKHYVRYLEHTVNQQAAHNLSYNFNLPKIHFRYQYSMRSLCDFLQMYMNIKLEPTIKWLVYKEVETLRIKNNVNINEVEYDEYSEHFSIVFNGKVIADNESSFTSYEDCSISFDLHTSKCYLQGTLEQIDWIINFLRKYGHELHTPVFKSFRGIMIVTSRAVYSKRVFQSLLKLNMFSKYWYTKSSITSNNNYQFLFKEIETSIINTNEYVQFNIQHLGKLNILDNEWKFTFDGNRYDYLLPFVSMLLAMIHFTNNLVYNPIYRNYMDAERAMLRFYTDKTGRNNPRKSTDPSLVVVAQRMITKKDVYNASISKIPRTEEEKLSYSGRSKPFLIHYFPPTDTVTVNKWVEFFSKAAMKENPLLQKRNTPQTKLKSGIFYIQFTKDEIVMFVNGYRHLIGHRRDSIDGEIPYWITYYPEKSNVYSIIEYNKIWLRKASISEKEPSTFHLTQSIRLRVQIKAQIENVVAGFTEKKAKKISFFEPYDLKENETPLEHLINHYGDKRIIITLCKQHMWDHSDEEILASINTFDMKKHQDLVQNYLQSSILYFEHDDKVREYELAFPRHKYWYSYNHYYEHLIFVFKNLKGMYEVLYFDNVTEKQRDLYNYRKLSVTDLLDKDRVKHFIKCFSTSGSSGYIKKRLDIGEALGDEIEGQVAQKKNVSEITYHSLMHDIRAFKDWYLDGQMFDSNGKSVGVRITRGDQIVDLRFAPQFPIMGPNGYNSLREVRDSATTTYNLPRELPKRYSIIDERKKSVKYDIDKLSNEHDERRHMLYCISRMIITHWLIFSRHTRNADIEEYVSKIIQPTSITQVKEQPIDRIVVPKFINKLDELEEYLSHIMPNWFHMNTFRVHSNDVIPYRLYMKRELEILVNMRQEFFNAFTTARMLTVLNRIDHDEIVDIRNIQELQTIHAIKEHLIDKRNYIFYIPNPTLNPDTRPWISDFDIKTKVIKESNNASLSDKLVITKTSVTKTELLVTRVNGTYYMIRFTNTGDIETAIYICHIWAKYNKICSFWETEIMAGTKRIFHADRNRIIEAYDNNLVEIAKSGQDYHILKYQRDQSIAFAAMLPIN